MSESATNERSGADRRDDPEGSPTAQGSDLLDVSSEHDEQELDAGDRRMLANVKDKLLGMRSDDIQIGRFRVQKELGRGNMGLVYAAKDPELDRVVALKVHKAAAPSERQREHMLREAKILAQFTHDNVVRVYEVGEHQGHVYVAMELVEGRTLKEIQDERPATPWRELVSLYIEAGRGLQAAHDNRVVHRDFKPTNVIVDASGRAQVLDFGLAQALKSDSEPTEEMEKIPSEPGAIERFLRPELSGSDAVQGSPAYMAPELFEGRRYATAYSDQFSFCVALYEALYGQRPFAGDTVQALVMSLQAGDVRRPPKDGRSVPSWVFEILRRGLSVDPSDRYPSIRALLAELERRLVPRWKSLTVPMAYLAGAITLGLAVIVPDWYGSASCVERAEGMATRWRETTVPSPAPGDEGEGNVTLELIGTEIDQLAAQEIAACSAPTKSPRLKECQARVGRDFDALLARASQERPRSTSFSNLVQDFEACLEDLPGRICAEPSAESPAAVHLRNAKVALGSDKYEEAIKDANSAIEIAGNDSLTKGRASMLLGEIYSRRDDVDKARGHFKKAFDSAAACSDSIQMIDSSLEIVQVELRHLSVAEEKNGIDSLETAETILKQKDPEGDLLPLRHARLSEKQGGVALFFRSDCTLAAEYYERSLRIRETVAQQRKAVGAPTRSASLAIADATYNKSHATRKCDAENPKKAITIIEEALAELDSAKISANHPARATYLQGLGIVLTRDKQFGDARASLEEAARIFGANGGEFSSRKGGVHISLANLLRQMGDLEGAYEHARKNLEIREKNKDLVSPRTYAAALGTVGVIAAARKDYDEAQRFHHKAIKHLEREGGALNINEKKQLGISYANEALAWCGIGNSEKATRSLEIAKEKYDDHSLFSGVEKRLSARGCLTP